MNYFLDNLSGFVTFVQKVAKKEQKLISIVLFVLILINILFFPSVGFAKISESNINFDNRLVLKLENYQILDNLINITPKIVAKEKKNSNNLPKSDELKVKYTRVAVFTAYNSEVGQCDSTPCITANGFNLCKHGTEDSMAMNGIKLGTKVRIPGLFGEKVFVIRDRMNSRYDHNRGDIWFINKADAIKFGAKRATIEILES